MPTGFTIDFVSLSIGLVLGAIFVFAYAMRRISALEKEKAAMENMGQTFDALAQESMKTIAKNAMKMEVARLKMTQVW